VQFAAQCTKELKTGQVPVRFNLRFVARQIAITNGLSGQKPDIWQTYHDIDIRRR